MSQASGHKRSNKSKDKSMYHYREEKYRQGYQPASPRYIKEEVANDIPYDPTHTRGEVIDQKMEQELRDQELARMLWKQEIQLAKRRHDHENRRTHDSNDHVNNVSNNGHNGNLNPHDKRSPSSGSSQYSDSPSLSNHHDMRHPASGGSAVNSASSGNDHHYHRQAQYNGNHRLYHENGKSRRNGNQSYYDHHNNHYYRHRKDNYNSEFQASDRSSNSDFQGSEDGDFHQGMGDSDWNPMKYKVKRQAQSDSSQSQDNSFESSNRTHMPKQFGNGFVPRSQLILEENNGDYNLSSRFRNSDGGKRWDMNRKAASKMPRQNQEFPFDPFSSRKVPVSNSMYDFRSPHPNGNSPSGPSPQRVPKDKILRQKIHSNNSGSDNIHTPKGKNCSSATVNDNDSDSFEHEYEIIEPEDINNIVTRNSSGSKATTSNVLAAIDPTVNKFGMAVPNRPNKLDYDNNKKKQFAVRQILSKDDAIALLQAGSTVLSQQLVIAKRRVSPNKTDSPPTDDRSKSKFKEFFQHLNHKKGKATK